MEKAIDVSEHSLLVAKAADVVVSDGIPLVLQAAPWIVAKQTKTVTWLMSFILKNWACGEDIVRPCFSDRMDTPGMEMHNLSRSQ